MSPKKIYTTPIGKLISLVLFGMITMLWSAQTVPSAIEIHQKMKASLGGLRNQTLKFDVMQVSAVLGDSTHTQGNLELGAKEQFWLKVGDQEWVYNGHDLWQISHKQKQVIWQYADSALGFQHPSRILLAFMDCAPYNFSVQSEHIYRLGLVPGKAFAEAESLWVLVEAPSYRPSELGMIDRESALTLYRLSGIRTKKYPAKHFEYKKSKGYELLDLRE